MDALGAVYVFFGWVGFLLAFVWLSDKCRGRRWFAKGKVIVITGASSGIGAEVARMYSEMNATVVLAARREDRLSQVAEECRRLGAQDVVTVVADVSKDDDCKKLMDAAGRKFDRIDCLVLNAGVGMDEFFEDLPDMSVVRRLMEVNFFGCVSCTQHALPYLSNSKRPRICVVSSVAGKLPCPTRSGYCASKFALHGFFDSLRIELAKKYNMTITMICPGPVNTEIDSSRLGTRGTRLNMKKAMSVQQCAGMITAAIASGAREVILPWTGWAGVGIRPFVPRASDWAIELFWRRGMSETDTATTASDQQQQKKQK